MKPNHPPEMSFSNGKYKITYGTYRFSTTDKKKAHEKYDELKTKHYNPNPTVILEKYLEEKQKKNEEE